ncbi:hypothetical protein JB92DRAFT_3110297 [Gautieria morchelliformis]|nr:hypothetical protein JB92DRAFT_3110297 [Gautieria morchelliformis]
MDKGAETKNKSSAKIVADHHRSLALQVLIPHHSGHWKDASLVQMGNVVKNCVNVIKKAYMSERTLLGETGAGLVETEDAEKEIIVGSAIDQLVGGNQDPVPLVLAKAAAYGHQSLEVVKSPAESALFVIDNDGKAEPSIETSEDNTWYSPFSFDANLPSEDPNDAYNEQSSSHQNRSKKVTVSMQKANMKPETVTWVALNSTTATRHKGLLDGLLEMQEARRATMERLAGQLNQSREDSATDFKKEKLKLEHQAHKEELDHAHALTILSGLVAKVPYILETFTGEDWHVDLLRAPPIMLRMALTPQPPPTNLDPPESPSSDTANRQEPVFASLSDSDLKDRINKALSDAGCWWGTHWSSPDPDRNVRDEDCMVRIRAVGHHRSGDIWISTCSEDEQNDLIETSHQWLPKLSINLSIAPRLYPIIVHGFPTSFDQSRDNNNITTLLDQNEHIITQSFMLQHAKFISRSP